MESEFEVTTVEIILNEMYNDYSKLKYAKDFETLTHNYAKRIVKLFSVRSNDSKFEKIYRLMNHDSSNTSPSFESYTVEEHNEQFGTTYRSAEEAIKDDPEYLFDEEDMGYFAHSS